MVSKNILIDTDAGADDISAIIWAAIKMIEKELNIVGITVTAGNTTVEQGCRNVQQALDFFNLDIPICKGSSSKLNGETISVDGVFGKDGMGDCDLIHPSKEEFLNNAEDFILETVKKYSGDISIISIAPVTNIAKAILKEPETMKHCSNIFSMGTAGLGKGNMTEYAEYNVYADAEAYDVLLKSGIETYVLGLDMCDGKAKWNKSNFSSLEEIGIVGNFVSKSFEKVFEYYDNHKEYKNDAGMNCDTLLLYTFLFIDNTKHVKYEKYYANCFTQNDKSYGFVQMTKTENTPVENNIMLVTELGCSDMVPKYFYNALEYEEKLFKKIFSINYVTKGYYNGINSKQAISIISDKVIPSFKDGITTYGYDSDSAWILSYNNVDYNGDQWLYSENDIRSFDKNGNELFDMGGRLKYCAPVVPGGIIEIRFDSVKYADYGLRLYYYGENISIIDNADVMEIEVPSNINVEDSVGVFGLHRDYCRAQRDYTCFELLETAGWASCDFTKNALCKEFGIHDFVFTKSNTNVKESKYFKTPWGCSIITYTSRLGLKRNVSKSETALGISSIMSGNNKDIIKSETESVLLSLEFGDSKNNNFIPINYDIEKELQRYKDMNIFDEGQLYEIELGLRDGVDVSVYAKSGFDESQMKVIRDGLKEGLDVSWYAIPGFDNRQMEVIKYGLHEGLDVCGIERKLQKYEEMNTFDEYQMIQIEIGLYEGLDVSVYAKPEFNPPQMQEIRMGLEKDLDVSIYSKQEFNYEQMCEIRYGLEEGLDVSIYAKYGCSEYLMRRIREGLEDGIDITTFPKVHLTR